MEIKGCYSVIIRSFIVCTMMMNHALAFDVIDSYFRSNTIYSTFYQNEINYDFNNNVIGDFISLDNYGFYRNKIGYIFNLNEIRKLCVELRSSILKQREDNQSDYS